jgi:DNA-directed RNA polymerase subunit M/transcription elongation factor TFIIS
MSTIRGAVREQLADTNLNDAIVDDIEHHIFKYVKNNLGKSTNCNKQLYQNIVDNLVSNLNENDSPLLHKLNNGELLPSNLLHDLGAWCPESSARVMKQVELEKKIKQPSLVANSSQYQCRGCKSRETYIELQQNRSSDEGMTVHIRCVKCGNYWRDN